MDYQGLKSVSGKGWIVNRLGIAGHMVSVSPIQLCYCMAKAAIDNMSTVHSAHGCVLIKLYL